ncbi:hypothetical protein EPA93_23700 [Ktedonosporobacter rubrisoli]|uniref:Uncharacterized protein n=1 Tax=Ktedonosporobacter rubrisoli TaxID=2509675 RepID=A0A4P6JU08_KTERU|nr:hypothetical protein [Ktedonosporobacter rubrisoli]QBD78825.1 hypothetical protein EPA93_23700 [Ktedonosporobacter rubrisoli]
MSGTFKHRKKIVGSSQHQQTETISLVVDRQAIHQHVLALIEDPEQAWIMYETWGGTHWRVHIQGSGRIVPQDEVPHLLSKMQDAHAVLLLKSCIMPQVLFLQGPTDRLLYGEDLLWRQRSFLTMAPEQG